MKISYYRIICVLSTSNYVSVNQQNLYRYDNITNISSNTNTDSRPYFYQYAYPTNILISVVIPIVILISVHLFFNLSLLYG